jgi:hypothetical protein
MTGFGTSRTRRVILWVSRIPLTWDDGKVFYWVTKYTVGVALKIVFRPWSRRKRRWCPAR